MATVSDTPWGNFTAADYSPEQWHKACLIQGDVSNKSSSKLPVREPSGALSRGGVHAAAGGHGISAVKDISEDERKTVAKKLVALYENELKEEPPESLESLAGVNETEDKAEDAKEMKGRSRQVWDRTFPLEGIQILTRAQGYGDGRTVEAYAAVFGTPQEIQDEHGHYIENNHRTAFNKTIADGAAKRALCLYHHGFNVVDRKPNPLGQVPLGRPLEIRADHKGLLTVTRYNRSELADAVLESIKNDDIKGQSYRGAIYRSNPDRIPRVRRGQPLPQVTRMELGLRDYGPTPSPYYEDANIVAVRARAVLQDIEGLDPDEKAELFRMMLATTHGDESESTLPTTPHPGAGPEEPQQHSGRAKLLRIQAEALFRGVTR